MDELEKKARRKEYRKEYREKNKERIMEKQKDYRKSEKGKKSKTINSWKSVGLKGDYETIYDRYIASTHCELCKQSYTKLNIRCMDHCHISGEFRHICCNSCNTNMPKQHEEITYDRYISPHGNNWQFQKIFKGKRYYKCRKSRIDLLCYKYIAFLQIRAQLRKLTSNT